MLGQDICIIPTKTYIGIVVGHDICTVPTQTHIGIKNIKQFTNKNFERNKNVFKSPKILVCCDEKKFCRFFQLDSGSRLPTIFWKKLGVFDG